MRRPHRLAFYLRHMESLGYSPAAILSGTGIDADMLQNPGYLVDDLQSFRVVANMLSVSGNTGLGFDIAEQIHAEDFGIVGRAMLSAPSFRDAGLFLQKYNDLSGGLARFLFLSTGKKEQWKVVVEPAFDMAELNHFCVDEFLCMTVALGEAITGKRFRLQQVDLSFTEPAHSKRYMRYFSCPVLFNQPTSGLTVESPGLDVTLPGSNRELSNLFQRHCQYVLQQISSRDSLSARLRALFLNDIGSIPTLDDAANALGLSGRTLRRQLHTEGCSYRDLVRKFRIDMAKELLRSGQLSIKALSYELGYANTSALRRAFKSETGMAISDYARGE